jgi:hypothetical protein
MEWHRPMAKYDSYSLRELKAAMRVAYANMAELRATHDAFRFGSTSLTQAADTLNSVTATAMGSWQGNAAASAQVAMSEVSRYSYQSVAACQQMAQATHGMSQATRQHHNQVDGIDEIDTSPMASMSASGMNPFVGTADHHDRVQRASANQKEAAAHARALDAASHEYASEMKAADWPRSRRRSTGTPPRTLPPRPAAPTPPGQPVTPAPVPPIQTAPPAPVPPHPLHNPPGPPSPVTAQGFDVPTLPAGVDVGSGATAGALASTGSAGGFAGLGAGALGAGALAGGSSGSSGGVSDPDGSGARGRLGAIDEEALRARGGSSLGAIGEAAGERGMLGAPMGGAGRRRSDDEKEHRLPDYFEEPEDTWLSADGGVVPVLGED